MMMMMISGFVERVVLRRAVDKLNKLVRLQMSSERRRGESCGSQSGW